MNTQPLIVSHLSKVFHSSTLAWWKREPSFTAVNNISFELKQGEILGFLGANGAGKTTTIQMLLNLLTPTSGTITYFGKNLHRHRSVMQDIAYASGYMKLPSSLTVRQSFMMQGRLYNIPSNDLYKRIDTFLKLYQIEHLANKNVSTLSAGQTTAVLLAQTCLVYPKIVLLDEPTATLDPQSANRIRDIIIDQNKKYGVSILFTSHNMAEVSDMCDRILVLQNGSIIADDTPESLTTTISVSRIQLMVGDGLKRTIAYAQENNIEFKVEGRHIELKIAEQNIATFLSELARQGIVYTQITIEKPTLEDYFLSIVSRK